MDKGGKRGSLFIVSGSVEPSENLPTQSKLDKNAGNGNSPNPHRSEVWERWNRIDVLFVFFPFQKFYTTSLCIF